MASTSRSGAEGGGREKGKTREFWVGSARAFGGAMVFTLPVLMTMEMWWLGFYMQRYRLLLLMLLMFPILVLLSRTLGFKETLTWGDDVADALVAYGIGLLASFAVLLLFGIVTFAMPLHAVIGKVSVQAVPASFGAMLARSQLGGGEGDAENEAGRDLGYAGELFFMVIGGIFLAFSLAPTQEILVIAFKMTPAMTVLLALTSLVIMHGFVYALNFKGQASRPEGVPLWNLFLRFTLVGYAISLLVSAYMLWTFGRFEGTSMAAFVEEAIVLGLPVSIGAAGARLMLGTSGSGEESGMSGSQRKGSDPSQEEARAEADRDRARGKKAPGTSTTEWVVAGISGIIVAGAIGFMLYDTVAPPSSPPAIELRVDTTLVVPGGYLVQFTARNTGTTTAASVQVEGSLMQDTTELERSQTTLDFVATQSRREAGLYFSRDPRSYRLELRPVGYTLP